MPIKLFKPLWCDAFKRDKLHSTLQLRLIGLKVAETKQILQEINVKFTKYGVQDPEDDLINGGVA